MQTLRPLNWPLLKTGLSPIAFSGAVTVLAWAIYRQSGGAPFGIGFSNEVAPWEPLPYIFLFAQAYIVALCRWLHEVFAYLLVGLFLWLPWLPFAGLELLFNDHHMGAESACLTILYPAIFFIGVLTIPEPQFKRTLARQMEGD